MAADWLSMAVQQTVVEPFVIAVIEALVLQGPFEIPIHLGHEGKVRKFRVHRPDRLWPEWFRGNSPGTLKDVRQ